MKKLIPACAILAASLFVGSQAYAANVAADDGSTAAYNDGFQSGDNGGTGFDAWTLRTDGNAGYFTANGSPDLNGIATSGKAWGFWANSPGFQDSVGFRGFTGGSLGVGEVFKISMENGGIQNGGSAGFTLRNGNANLFGSDYNYQSRFEFFFLGGNANYRIADGSGTLDTGIGWSDGGLDLTFTLTSANTYSLTVYRIASNETYTFVNRTLGGTADTGLDSVAVYNRDAENNDVFFNKLSVVPEPSSALLVMGAVGAAMASRRRRS